MRLNEHGPAQSRTFLTRLGVGFAAAAMLAACAGGAALAGDVKSGPAPEGAVKVEAGDNFFQPESLKLKPGDTVTVEVTNAGNRPHDWTSDGAGVSTGVIAAGDVVHATFTVPDNDIEFVCTLHPGMDGTIEVT